MNTIFDYATNSSCPQRPTWQISPVGYKWAQAVFGDCKQSRARDIKKGVEAWPKPVKIWRRFLFQLKQAV